jgi:hypothetical protein
MIRTGYGRAVSLGLCTLLLTAVVARGGDSLNLAGRWRFALDAQDLGLAEAWPNRTLDQQITQPGCLQAQGFGERPTVDTQWTGDIVDRSWFTDPRMAKYRQPGNVKIPFWLQPDRHYVGPAWYQRDLEIPAAWRNRRVTLYLERCHWETQAWLDGRSLGRCDSLGTPHVYELGTSLAPGKHRLTLRVDNRMQVEVGVNAHSVSDHTQSNWNGVVGRMELRVTDPVWIDRVQVDPDVPGKRVKVALHVANATGTAGKVRVGLQANGHTAQVEAALPTGGVTLNVVVPVGDAPCWDEFHPALQQLSLGLAAEVADRKLTDQRTVAFGMRTLGVDGTQFTLNGRRIFLRGTLECCIFPKTGYPPTDVDSWRRIIRICRAHGLNHLRFHSWCPPEAAFTAGDELGFYFSVECSAWVNQGATVGDGHAIDRWLYAEGDRILETYGNHPCFLLLCPGNEPGGRNQKRYLGDLVEHFKKRDSRHLYTAGAGWPFVPENQFHLTPAPRIQAWGGGLKSRINARAPETTTDYREAVQKSDVPLVSHEIGQWCVYPNFDEIPKYTGYLKPRNFEIFRETLTANHMGDQARQFLLASGKLQTLCYKEEIESALRTPGFAGFHLLDLHDFPGQGTALVGVLDPFWDSKPYVSPAEYHRFCGATVPLARLAKRMWSTAETLVADLEVTHFGAQPLSNAVATWRLVDAAGRAHASGRLTPPTIAIGNARPLGRVAIELKQLPAPAKYRLVVALDAVSAENDWDLWVFPEQLDTSVPAGIHVTERLDAAAEAALRAGGRVLLALKPSEVDTPVKIGFSSIFWNTAWTRGQPPHTLGILCDPQHPLFSDFPTEYHSNWQWWELVHDSAAMVLDRLPPGLRALVQPIDTWFENRRLGLLFECRAAGGRLMVVSMDLSTDLDHRLVARQMRRAVLRYMASPAFQPSVDVDLATLRVLATPKQPKRS